MKITDDYQAECRLWVENPRVVPASKPVRIPRFKSERLVSRAEMNAGQDAARRKPARWTAEITSPGTRE